METLKPNLGDVIYGKAPNGSMQYGEVFSMMTGHPSSPDVAFIHPAKRIAFKGRIYYVYDGENPKQVSIPFSKISEIVTDGTSTTEYGFENTKLSAASPDGIIRRSITLGAPPPAYSKEKVDYYYKKMVDFKKQWNGYQKLGTTDLKRLYQQTSRIDYGSMGGIDKGSLIAGIMESKVGRNGFPSELSKNLEKLTGITASEWDKRATRESQGKSVAPLKLPSTTPEPTTQYPTSSTSGAPVTTTKLPAPGFKEENRLGWTRDNFSVFFNRTKPGSEWTDLKKWITKGNIWSESTNGGQNQCDILISLFSGSAPYPGLVTLFQQLKVVLKNRDLAGSRKLISRIEPRIVRLWNFGRAQRIAKSIVTKSLNKRLI